MEDLPHSVLLFLCHGALAMLEWKNSSTGENGVKLLLDIISVVLEFRVSLSFDLYCFMFGRRGLIFLLAFSHSSYGPGGISF